MICCSKLFYHKEFEITYLLHPRIKIVVGGAENLSKNLILYKYIYMEELFFSAIYIILLYEYNVLFVKLSCECNIIIVKDSFCNSCFFLLVNATHVFLVEKQKSL